MRYPRVAFLAASLPAVALLAARYRAPMSVVVSPSSQTVKKRESVLLKVNLTNRSKHNLVFNDGNLFCDYPMEIRDSDGNEPPQTAYKRESRCDLAPAVISRNILIVLKPGETRSEPLNTADYYDLRRVGTYTIRLFRHLPTEISEQDIPANSVTARVTE